MTSLVYLCARPQEGAAAAEYESFRTAMRLGEDELERWDLVRETLPSDFTARWRGAVVGGSPFNVTDPEDTKTDAQRGLEASLARLADAAASGRIAALFTCYGIGVATRTLGGEVTRAYPEDTGPAAITLTADGRRDRQRISGRRPGSLDGGNHECRSLGNRVEQAGGHGAHGRWRGEAQSARDGDIAEVERAALPIPQQPGTRVRGHHRGTVAGEVEGLVPTGIQCSGDHGHGAVFGGLAHRPGGIGALGLHHALRCARNTDQISARKLVELSAFDHRRIHGLACDETGRGEVEHRVQVVTHPDIERRGRPVGQHRIGTGDTRGAQQAEDEAPDKSGDDDDSAHAECAGLGTQRINEHPGVV